MTPLIKSGQQVTVRPLQEDDVLEKGDIVLCKVRGDHYLHLVKSVRGEHCLIGNNKGRVNGWAHRSRIYGKYVRNDV